MWERFRQLLIHGEAKLRILLYGFCIYSAIYAAIIDLFSKYAHIVDNYVFIIITGAFSFCAGLVLNEEIEILKKDYEWSWTAKNKSEYIQTEYIGLGAIGLLYFVVQMGIMVMFFPEFEQVRIGSNGIQFFPIIFIFNSFIIYIIYRLTFIKIELIESNHES